MSEDGPLFRILCGGTSGEREVSLVSGANFAEALATGNDVEKVVLDEDRIPESWLPSECVIVPMLHGSFGEDGRLQQILEQRGFAFAGTGSEGSRRCMEKPVAKSLVSRRGVPVLDEIVFAANARPEPREVVEALGERLVVKPTSEGSSVGLHVCHGVRDLTRVLEGIDTGVWMIEPCLAGCDLSVGVLSGSGLGVVSIRPRGGIYDYQSKYHASDTVYRCPAEIPDDLTARIRGWAETAFDALLCRDFARVDFFLGEGGRAVFLECNTLPGMTPASLFPKSAADRGYDFCQLVREMVDRKSVV